MAQRSLCYCCKSPDHRIGNCPTARRMDCKYDKAPGGCNRRNCVYRHGGGARTHVQAMHNDTARNFMNMASMDSAIDTIEQKTDTNSSNPDGVTIRLLPLYCAVCEKSSRLNWPISHLRSTQQANFSYIKQLEKWAHKLDCNNDKNYTRLNGKNMTHNRSKSKCEHQVGYGKVICLFCGENVTKQFNPSIWKCPNPKCDEGQKGLHTAVSTHGSIKLH